jgi:hypothetical protein
MTMRYSKWRVDEAMSTKLFQVLCNSTRTCNEQVAKFIINSVYMIGSNLFIWDVTLIRREIVLNYLMFVLNDNMHLTQLIYNLANTKNSSTILTGEYFVYAEEFELLLYVFFPKQITNHSIKYYYRHPLEAYKQL